MTCNNISKNNFSQVEVGKIDRAKFLASSYPHESFLL